MWSANGRLRVLAAALNAWWVIACLPRDQEVGRETKRAELASASTASAKAKATTSPRSARAPAVPRATASTAASGTAVPSSSGASPGVVAQDPLLRSPFTDSFDRPELGRDWHVTSNAWAIRNGQLCGRSARNHPAWLARRLPVNARIEFDAISASADGDLKAEFWGDGRSSARGVSYQDATSYLTIFGGWKNHFHVLARKDEHARDRLEIAVDQDSDDVRAAPVVAQRSYRFKIERTDGKTIRWLVDDVELLALVDPEPLSGPGHEHFGFNDWEVQVCFDNLTITPL